MLTKKLRSLYPRNGFCQGLLPADQAWLLWTCCCVFSELAAKLELRCCCLWMQMSDEDREKVNHYLDQYPGQVQKIFKVHVNVDDDCEGEDCDDTDDTCDCGDDDCDCEEVGPQPPAANITLDSSILWVRSAEQKGMLDIAASLEKLMETLRCCMSCLPMHLNLRR